MKMSAFLKGAEENTKQCHSYSLVEADFSFKRQQKRHAVTQSSEYACCYFFATLINFVFIKKCELF